MMEEKILQDHYKKAKQIFENKHKFNLPSQVVEQINFMIDKIASNKSLVTALATSCVKKIMNNTQDIRLHRTDFEGGYSARVLDTKFTTPFFKRHFPKYANKESAFLTLATREKIKWTIKEGKNLKIRNKELKGVFLKIFDNIQKNKIPAQTYLIAIFIALIKLSEKDEKIFRHAQKTNIQKTLNINIVLQMLEKHFETKLGSRLPVIAIYSIYEILMPLLTRYHSKILLPLNVHTASDKHGYGDIEILDSNKKPFEIVEIKHNKPITLDFIFDIAKKTEKANVKRYYILTTYPKGFENKKVENHINNFILRLKAEKGIDIIANGILTTLKYYLRFVSNYTYFLEVYTNNLIQDAKLSTEIKDFHIKNWIKIINI